MSVPDESGAAAASTEDVPAAPESKLPVSDSDEGRSSDGFVKTLQSDVADDQAYELLVGLSKSGGLLHSFTSHELHLMSKILCVLRFREGETLITRGEAATFCGIILRGKCQAVVSTDLRVPLDPGSLIGEMAFFEGGVRSADIVADSDVYLALITFQELYLLRHTHVNLQLRLVHLLGSESIRKLRRSLQNAHQEVTKIVSLTPEQERELEAKNRRAVLAVLCQEETSSSQQMEIMRSQNVERLFRSRLKQQKRKHARVVESERSKLQKALAENSNLLVRLKHSISRGEKLEQQVNTLQEALRSQQNELRSTQRLTLKKQLEEQSKLRRTQRELQETQRAKEVLDRRMRVLVKKVREIAPAVPALPTAALNMPDDSTGGSSPAAKTDEYAEYNEFEDPPSPEAKQGETPSSYHTQLRKGRLMKTTSRLSITMTAQQSSQALQTDSETGEDATFLRSQLLSCRSELQKARLWQKQAWGAIQRMEVDQAEGSAKLSELMRSKVMADRRRKEYFRLCLYLICKMWVYDRRSKKLLVNMYSILNGLYRDEVHYLYENCLMTKVIWRHSSGSEVSASDGAAAIDTTLEFRNKEEFEEWKAGSIREERKLRAPRVMYRHVLGSLMELMQRYSFVATKVVDQVKFWRETATGHQTRTVQLKNQVDDLHEKLVDKSRDLGRIRMLLKKNREWLMLVRDKLSLANQRILELEERKRMHAKRKAEEEGEEVAKLADRSQTLRAKVLQLQVNIRGLQKKRERLRRGEDGDDLSSGAGTARVSESPCFVDYSCRNRDALTPRDSFLSYNTKGGQMKGTLRPSSSHQPKGESVRSDVLPDITVSEGSVGMKADAEIESYADTLANTGSEWKHSSSQRSTAQTNTPLRSPLPHVESATAEKWTYRNSHSGRSPFLQKIPFRDKHISNAKRKAFYAHQRKLAKSARGKQ